MRRLFLDLYRRNRAGRVLLAVPRHLCKSIAGCLSDEAWCRTMFSWNQGYPLNTRNPSTLNEKLQVLMLRNQNSELGVWADKYRVRKRVADTIGDDCLVPLLAVGENPSQIEFEKLPEPFIIKPTHSSGRTIIVKNRKDMQWHAVRETCKRWLKSNFYRQSRERHYRHIPPRIIVETLLQDENGGSPMDFKCHCLDGKAVFIQVDIDRHTNHKRNFYDRNWSRLPFSWSICSGDVPMWPGGREVERPSTLPQMLAASEAIANRFQYVRIDWYTLQNRIFFGETTFNHGGGFERILPIEWDYKLGEQLTLNSLF